ncbi:hypothetical protein Clacol_000601 [Clathrus columnatus]|uniref:Conserved oligomeric Golgi complex subunit 2 n=1 Tax=Clathrus columnatus TaxID=1419009 RepID=A0AAV5A077_9AGAM|nr:hypothetical protein Clacol_000601 [Clathrus columnatus]
MDGIATTTDRISALISDKPGTEELLATSIDLAALQPLSHTNPFLSAETFSVENFLISRSHSSLSDFRAELRGYYGVLKEELVKLINDDYTAFISLSTDLRGEGVRIEKLKHPLGNLNQEIQSSVDQLKQIQETIQHKLDERAALREEKARLHLLLKLSETLVRLESLLFITKEELSETAFGNLTSRVIQKPDESFLETRSRTNRVKHVSRIATEFNQLLYLADKARQDKCAFVDEIQWRVDRVKTTLSSDLNHLFSVLLLADSSLETSNSQDFDPARRKFDIKECLRIYDSIGSWREAEEIIRRELVTPFIRQAIFPGALAVPHSPLAPRTPFTTHPASPGPFTPKTPYTAYPNTPWPRKTPIDTYFNSADFQLPLLNDLENPLASIFNKILRFIERDLKLVLELAETFSERYHQPNTSTKDPCSPSESPGFEIMSNVVWADIGHAIMEGLGTTIFAAGRPDDFHENYMTTQRFIEALEVLAPSLSAINKMRNHPVYLSFRKRWQLPVYFQLRWKDVVGDLESVLSLPSEGRITLRDGSAILSRYCVWLETLEVSRAPKNDAEKAFTTLAQYDNTLTLTS